MDTVRNLFVVQMYTGMAYADLMAFDLRNYRQVNGKWQTINERIKTGVGFVSVLLPPVVRVLEQYGGVLPQMTNEAYNRGLKELGEKAGIDAKMHSHLARHTFATWMLTKGVKIENVAKMLGHANIRHTQRYAKVLAKDVTADFERVADGL